MSAIRHTNRPGLGSRETPRASLQARARRGLRGAAALALLLAPLHAQGRFANFETPQTHPIEIATVNDRDYVLVCNTPDNSVDIYTAAAPHTFVQRVPVGMGPGSVRWNAKFGRFYTCNFDGDSVSIVRLDPSGSSVVAVLERTASLLVGDEPADIAFDNDNGLAVISLSSSSSATLLNSLDLSFAGGTARLTAPAPSGTTPFAVKMPRQVAWLPDGRFFVANLRAGSPGPSSLPPAYDLGIYRKDPMLPSGQADFASGLGTTNHAFAISGDGGLMFVVGTKAQNHAAVGVQAVGQLKTGFVQSWLMVLDIPPGGSMSVHGEATPATLPAAWLPSINLNRDYSATTLTELPTAQALVQPTDVLLIEDGDALTSIVLTAFHSDRVAILTPTTAVACGYSIQRVDVPVLNPGSSYSTAGPRGLAYSKANKRLFVCDRLDNTLSVIDPSGATLITQIQLPNDPTPNEIRAGRRFLYSNRFSIDATGAQPRGGFVSCAACHVDGRTDGLPWDLGDTALGPNIPPEFHDLNSFTPTSLPQFPSEKGPMVTQTLQGLVNYQVNEEFQFASTNAPYHWRGDKRDFTDFNEAFVNLQRMANIGTATDPLGITATDMIAYRRFVNTILHPPNPEQDLLRVTPGTLGSDPNDPLTATGGKLGAMLFHNQPVVGFRACVDCHPLPDGSTNTSTLPFPILRTLTTGLPQNHPLESGALRNIAQREMVLHSGFSMAIDQRTANSGVLHPGDPGFLTSLSINLFIQSNFAMPGPSAADKIVQKEALTRFVRQLDTGTAPLAGFAFTVDPSLSPLNSGLNQTAFDIGESQVAEANVGLGVFTRKSGVVRGYWYDTTVTPPGYREEGTTNVITRSALLLQALGADNVVIAQATPLGTERRWSNPNGIATPIADLTHVPANIVLEKMAPNTAFVDIPNYNGNIDPTPPAASSEWTLTTLKQSVSGSFGVPASLRHEPPRRFRVTSDNIRPGAKLLLGMASAGAVPSLPVNFMIMDLYPTTHVSGGKQIWETLLELDPTQTFAYLNGGYFAPSVADVLLRTTTSPSLNPSLWNAYLVGILNEDGSVGYNLSGWQNLRIQDVR